MAYTIPPFAVNSSTWTTYVVQTDCRVITFSEVGQGVTADYYVVTLDKSGNMDAANLWTRAAGSEISIPGIFQRGDRPFAIKSASGSPNFDGIEKP